MEEGRELSNNELIVKALELLDPDLTVRELVYLIKNDDIDLFRMIESRNE